MACGYRIALRRFGCLHDDGAWEKENNFRTASACSRRNTGAIAISRTGNPGGRPTYSR
jgi:hypothetical protein